MHSRVLGIPIPDDTALIPGQWIDLAAPHKWPGIVLLLEDERPDGRTGKMIDHLLPQRIPWHRGRDDARRLRWVIPAGACHATNNEGFSEVHV